MDDQLNKVIKQQKKSEERIQQVEDRANRENDGLRIQIHQTNAQIEEIRVDIMSLKEDQKENGSNI